MSLERWPRPIAGTFVIDSLALADARRGCGLRFTPFVSVHPFPSALTRS